jgi:hypothetical protein
MCLMGNNESQKLHCHDQLIYFVDIFIFFMFMEFCFLYAVNSLPDFTLTIVFVHNQKFLKSRSKTKSLCSDSPSAEQLRTTGNVSLYKKGLIAALSICESCNLLC